METIDACFTTILVDEIVEVTCIS